MQNQNSATNTQSLTLNTSASSSTVDASISLSTSTSNWKTYTNTQYGFSFKYPADWENPIVKNNMISFGTANPENYRGVKLSITIVYNGNNTVDELMANESSATGGVSFGDIQKATLNGYEVRKFTAHAEGGFVTNELYVVQGGYVYEFENGNRLFGDRIPETVSQADQILSTFKFTTPSSLTGVVSTTVLIRGTCMPKFMV